MIKFYDKTKAIPKKTWSVIREIVDFKKNSQTNFPTSLMINKQTRIINSEKFLNQMFEYFVTIGLNLSKKFSTNQLSNFKIYTAASLQSFMLLDIVEGEVAHAINNIKKTLLLEPMAFLQNLLKWPKYFYFLFLLNYTTNVSKKNAFRMILI